MLPTYTEILQTILEEYKGESPMEYVCDAIKIAHRFTTAVLPESKEGLIIFSQALTKCLKKEGEP